jgi:hypothetical protein
MTVLYSSIHAWAAAFCPGCEKLVHYQASDVLKGFVPVGPDPHIGQVRHYIDCKCGHQIEIARG